MTLTKKSNAIKYLIFTLSFVGLALMMFCMPYFKDDWAWGSQIGIDRLNSAFADYNGRYLGNLLIIALTRSKVLKIIVMALCDFALPWLLYRYVGKNQMWVYLGALFFLFTMPADMFRTTVVWASGFSNYMPPVLITLAYLGIIANVFGSDKPKYSRFLPVLALILGVAGGLFMEHITIYNVLLAIVVIVFSKIKFKKFFATHITFFVGAIIGAVIMFTNSSYGFITGGKDHYNYRSVAGEGKAGGLGATLAKNIKIMAVNITEDNVLINVALAILCAVIVYRLIKLGTLSAKKRLAVCVSCAVVAVYGVYSGVLFASAKLLHINIQEKIPCGIRFVFGILFTLALAAFVVAISKDVNESLQRVFPVVSIYVFCAPLVIVTPLTSRCFLPCFAMEAIVALQLLKKVLDETDEKKKKSVNNLLKVFFCIALITLGAYYSYVFATIRSFSVERENFVNQQIEDGKTSVYLPKYPGVTGNYVRGVTPKDDSTWEKRFKMFYSIDKDVDLIIISTDDYNLMK